MHSTHNKQMLCFSEGCDSVNQDTGKQYGKRYHPLLTQMHHSIRTEHFFFANLLNHKNNSEMSAEWPFFATSHGKGPNDTAGGTTKKAGS
jgi:hypothetical protein